MRCLRSLFARTRPKLRLFKSVDIEAVEMGLESLEARLHLAGNVSVVVDGGNLLITGDADDNSISITETGGTFNISGFSGTTVTGGTGVSGVSGDIVIELDRGQDRVTLNGVVAPGSVFIDGGTDANFVRVINSNVAENLTIENGAARSTSQNSDVNGHETEVSDSQVGGDLIITHGKATVSARDGDAAASEVNVSNNLSIVGNVLINVAQSRSTAKEGDSIGAYTIVEGNEIGGSLNVSHQNMSATGDFLAKASEIDVVNNSTISGQVNISHGNTRATSKVYGSQLGSSTEIEDNTSLGGILIQSGSARSSGPSSGTSRGNQVDVKFNSTISGDVDVSLGKANVRATEYGSAEGNSVEVTYNDTISGGISIANGNAVASGYSGSGNEVILESNWIGSDVNVTNGSGKATSTGSTFFGGPSGNRIQLSSNYGYGNTIMGDVTLANGTGQATAAFGYDVSATGNSASTGNYTEIQGNVTITNGKGSARSNGNYASAVGNRARVNHGNIIGGNVEIANGVAKASAISGQSSGATGNFAGIGVAEISGDVTLVNSNGTSSVSSNGTYYSSGASGNFILVSPGATIAGMASMAQGNGKATNRDSGSATGIATSFSASNSGANIAHGSGRAIGGSSATSTGNRVSIGTSMTSGPLKIELGSSSASGGVARDSESIINGGGFLDTFEFASGRGDDRLTIQSSNFTGSVVVSMGSNDDLFTVENSQFMSTLEFNGDNNTDEFDDVAGNTFSSAPSLIDVEIS